MVVASGIGAVTYGMAAALFARTAFVFDDQNIEYELAYGTSFIRFGVVYVLERSACALASLVVVPTLETKTALTSWTEREIKVITNGYDAETFTPEGESVTFTDPVLLYFGNYRYEPNIEAVEFIAIELCPRLAAETDARVLLAGPGFEHLPTECLRPGTIQSLSFVDGLPAVIRGADLVIVPLRNGSGSRLKIIESLACGTRVISTPIGAEGWPSDWENLVIADHDAFVDETIELLNDVTFDRTEDEKFVKYSWQAQSAKFANYVHSLLKDDRGGSD
jgi:glycosyltransferase involved in cell wall biosynthesis